MTVSTIIYTRMNSEMMNTGTQMPGMKTMLYFMPIMLLFVFNSLPQVLATIISWQT
jgi:YidC/Oxa1 family membrane protein insertase